MKIITQQLANKLPEDHNLLVNKTINPLDLLSLRSTLKEAQQLTIYDITSTKKHPPETIISVNDHINRTGKNPLIDYHKEQDIDFINTINMYKKEQNSVSTDCCGKELNIKYPYPSHYLCNISILGKALGIQEIAAYLVNIP